MAPHITRKDIMRFSTTKGQNHPLAKLTMKQIYEIRAIKDMKQVDIAKKYNVTQGAISKIVNNIRWNF